MLNLYTVLGGSKKHYLLASINKATLPIWINRLYNALAYTTLANTILMKHHAYICCIMMLWLLCSWNSGCGARGPSLPCWKLILRTGWVACEYSVQQSIHPWYYLLEADTTCEAPLTCKGTIPSNTNVALGAENPCLAEHPKQEPSLAKHSLPICCIIYTYS